VTAQGAKLMQAPHELLELRTFASICMVVERPLPVGPEMQQQRLHALTPRCPCCCRAVSSQSSTACSSTFGMHSTDACTAPLRFRCDFEGMHALDPIEAGACKVEHGRAGKPYLHLLAVHSKVLAGLRCILERPWLLGGGFPLREERRNLVLLRGCTGKQILNRASTDR
jgi:hypothetical protein